jgi:N-acetylglutamate synthase-like GNAT family acetyltransferase
MNCGDITITDATPDDLRAILDLLSRVQLPHDGVAENISGFLVARDESLRLVATIGLERHGSTVLLRSAAVTPEYQGCGIGSRLTEHLLERATNNGIERVVLLRLQRASSLRVVSGFAKRRALLLTKSSQHHPNGICRDVRAPYV